MSLDHLPVNKLQKRNEQKGVSDTVPKCPGVNLKGPEVLDGRLAPLGQISPAVTQYQHQSSGRRLSVSFRVDGLQRGGPGVVATGLNSICTRTWNALSFLET